MQLNDIIINKIQSDLQNHKILVMGDIILDRYWFGDVERISPEAPVPITKINHTENRPGGAANVARNIASLGGKVSLLSVVGEDEAADNLKFLLKKANVDTILKHDKDISTIIKLRVLARNQQLIRLDFEEPPSHNILSEILDIYKNIVHDYDVIILSDYSKGGLSHITKIIEIAKKHNKIILVDPKGSDYSKYSGSTIITPNKNELREVVGSWNSEQELTKKALQLKAQLNLEHLLLTRSEEGMTLYSNNDESHNYSTIAQEVYDVSGAGDTVIATLGLMLANNILIQDAIKIANIAASIVVGKVGTATLSKDELLHAITQVNN